MCGRYRLDADQRELEEIIRELNRREEKAGADKTPVKTNGDLYPGDRVPVLCRGRSGGIGAFAMEWGYRMEDGRRLINARLETAAQKPSFRDGMQNRRCLMPMSAYYEWEKRGNNRVKYRIAPRAEGLSCLAGVYRLEEDGPRFAVLTMEAAEEIAFIHDRMPVLVPYVAREAWLLRGELPPPPAAWTAVPEGDVQLTLDALLYPPV
ncbi:MAG: SOS response-associated peptidase [Clostridia bacterium]|nr:SOS response-associated peptidase [Clostridia bacterium]